MCTHSNKVLLLLIILTLCCLPPCFSNSRYPLIVDLTEMPCDMSVSQNPQYKDSTFISNANPLLTSLNSFIIGGWFLLRGYADHFYTIYSINESNQLFFALSYNPEKKTLLHELFLEIPQEEAFAQLLLNEWLLIYSFVQYKSSGTPVGTYVTTRIYRAHESNSSIIPIFLKSINDSTLRVSDFIISTLTFNVGYSNSIASSAPSCSYVKYISILDTAITTQVLKNFIYDFQGMNTKLLRHFDSFYTDANRGKLFSLDPTENAQLTNSNVSDSFDFNTSKELHLDHINASTSLGFTIQFSFQMSSSSPADTQIFSMTANTQTFLLTTKGGNTLQLNTYVMTGFRFNLWTHIIIIIQQGVIGHLLISANGIPSNRLYIPFPIVRTIHVQFGLKTNSESFRFNSIRVFQGIYFEESDDCYYNIQSSISSNNTPSCLLCKFGNLISMQLDSKCFATPPAISDATYPFEQQWSPVRTACQTGMIHDRTTGNCRCRIQEYADSAGTCQLCPRYCNTCTSPLGLCPLTSDSNRIQTSGECQPGTFDDGFNCYTASEQIQLFPVDKSIYFFSMPLPTYSGTALNTFQVIFNESVLNFQTKQSFLFTFSFLPKGIAIYSKHVIATVVFNGIDEVITVYLTTKSEGLSVSFQINGIGCWEQLILSNSNSWFAIWTNGSTKTVFQIHSNWEIVSKEITSPIISALMNNPEICVGSCTSLYAGFNPGIGIFNIRPFNFIADTPSTQNYQSQVVKLLLDEPILFTNFMLDRQVYLDVKFGQIASKSVYLGQFIDFLKTEVNVSEILKGFGFTYQKTEAVYSLPNIIFPPSIATSIYFNRIISQTTLIWYKFTNDITIEYFLIPFEQSRNVGIRICVQFECQDSITARLNIGEPNFLAIFTMDRSPYQIDFLRISFQITCNYFNEKIVFNIPRPKEADITLDTINFFKQSEWTSDYLIFLNRIMIINGNSYFYYDTSTTTTCYMRLGFNPASSICIQPKRKYLIQNNIVIPKSGCVPNSTDYLFQNPNTRECLSIIMPPNCIELDLVTTFKCKKCQDGYYQQIGSYNCLPCDLKCATCSVSSSICDTCHQTFLQIPPTCECLLKNYFLNSSYVCEQCSDRCEECSESSSNCSSCSIDRIDPPNCECDSQTMIESPIQITNPVNGQIISTTQCTAIVCDYKCETCEYSPSNCVTCKENRGPTPTCACFPNYYSDLSGDCQTCKQGMYVNLPTLTCMKCDASCFECSNSAKNCISCEEDLTLKNHTCECANSYIQIKKSDGLTSICAKEIEIISFTVSLQSSSKNYILEFVFPIQLLDINFKAKPPTDLLELSFEGISANMFSLQNPLIAEDTLSVQLIPSVEFKATTGYVAFKQYLPFISTTEDQVLSHDYLSKPFLISSIGPFFLQQATNTSTVSLSQMNESIKKIDPTIFSTLQGLQIMFYFLDTLQPTALFLLIQIQYPPYLYSFLQIIGSTIFPKVLDYQTVQSANITETTTETSTSSFQFSLNLPSDQITKNQNKELLFKRIGLSNSVLISIPIILAKYLIIYLLIFFFGILKYAQKQQEQLWSSTQKFLEKRVFSEVEVNLLISCLSILLNFETVNSQQWVSRVGFYASILILIINALVICNLAAKIINTKSKKHLLVSNILSKEQNCRKERSEAISTQSDKNNNNNNLYDQILTQDMKKKRIAESKSYFFFQLILKFFVVLLLYSFREFPQIVCLLCGGCFAISATLTIRMKPYLSLRTRHIKSFTDCIFAVCWVLCCYITNIEMEMFDSTSPNTIDADLSAKYASSGQIVVYLLVLSNIIFILEQICCLFDFVITFFRKRNARKQMLKNLNQSSEFNLYNTLVFDNYSNNRFKHKNGKEHLVAPSQDMLRKEYQSNRVFLNNPLLIILKRRKKDKSDRYAWQLQVKSPS